jgi:hypothetical protein
MGREGAQAWPRLLVRSESTAPPTPILAVALAKHAELTTGDYDWRVRSGTRPGTKLHLSARTAGRRRTHLRAAQATHDLRNRSHLVLVEPSMYRREHSADPRITKYLQSTDHGSQVSKGIVGK